MAVNRLEALQDLVARNPQDHFARFGLAMEYAKAGGPEQAAEQFRALLTLNPDYWGAYYHLGQVLEALGRPEEARAAYEKGVQVTARLGQAHARSELETALDLLG